MIGPVFAREWLLAGRRRRAYVLRWIFGAILLGEFVLAYSVYAASATEPGAFATFAVGVLDRVLLQQFIFVLLVTPGLVAGAITDEKTTGTLDALLISRLDPFSIVAGKLAARLADVAVLTLAALPFVALTGSFAGVGIAFVMGQGVVTLLTAFGLSCVSLLASVWTRSTRAAALGVYFVVLIASAVYWAGWQPVAGWVQRFDPLWVLAPAREGGGEAEFFRRLLVSAVAWIALGVVCTAIAAWRLRPAYAKQRSVRRRWFALGNLRARPAPTWNPCTWQERYIGRRIPHWLLLPAVAAVTAALTWYSMQMQAVRFAGAPLEPVEAIISQGWLMLALLAVVVGTHASGVISSERERRTWDGLLCTPMNDRDLVQGKMRGVVAGAWPLVLAYLLTSAATTTIYVQNFEAQTTAALVTGTLVAAAVMTLLAPRVARKAAALFAIAWAAPSGPAVFAAVVAVLVVAWLTMQFVSAVGIWCSVRCTGSWRSLLLTSVMVVGGGVVLTCASLPVACITGLLGALVTGLLEMALDAGADFRPKDFADSQTLLSLVPMFFATGIALVYWLVARSLLIAAEVYLSRTDRMTSGRVRQQIVDALRRERLTASLKKEALHVPQ